MEKQTLINVMYEIVKLQNKAMLGLKPDQASDKSYLKGFQEANHQTYNLLQRLIRNAK